MLLLLAGLSFSNIYIKTFLCVYVRLFVVDAHVARLNKQIEKPVFPIPISLAAAVRWRPMPHTIWGSVPAYAWFAVLYSDYFTPYLNKLWAEVFVRILQIHLCQQNE